MTVATDFFMRYWPSAISLLLALSAQAQPATARLDAAGIQQDRLDALFVVALSPTMSDALDRGIELSFSLQVRGARLPMPEHARLSYQPLSRRYVLSRHGDLRVFALRDSALRALGGFDGIPLTEVPTNLSAVEIRLKLDRAELPAPLRLPAYLSAHWRLDSGWIALQ
jgi:Domain of unknown function (DUF4390)